MSNLILDRPAVRREPPKPQTWLLFGPSSALTTDGRTSLQDLPAIALSRWAKDLTRQHFGRLIALRPVEKQWGNLVWLCQCSCGQLTKAKSGNLSNGNTTSCGCLRGEKTGQSLFKNLQGQRFGRLIVLSQNGKTKAGRIKWLCQCSCGKQTTIPSGDLLTGHTKSCSCLQKEKTRQRAGPKSPSWNPLLTVEDREKYRFGIDQIRNQVFLRDGYLCILCKKHGKSLNAHHMEPWSKNPTLRFDPDNMVTLCKSCHQSYHHEFSARRANSTNFVLWFRQQKEKLKCRSFPGKNPSPPLSPKLSVLTEKPSWLALPVLENRISQRP